MSAAEIIEELPKLTPEERVVIALRLRELKQENDDQFLHEAADEMFRDMDQREAEDAHRKTRWLAERLEF